MTTRSLRHRFPGIDDDWARFDGPAGTQMVDTAIEAVSAWMASGSTAAAGGWFAAAQDCSDLIDRARTTVGELLGGDPAGVAFGPNSTSNLFALSRAVGRMLRPGDRIVGTALDHDSNITPWRLAAEAAGAEHVLAPFSVDTCNLVADDVIALIDERTRWVTLPGASNLLGSIPDLAPIVEAAHDVGARVFVDAVHLAAHRRIDIAALGCDALVTSPYKWYGPHSGVAWIEPGLLAELPVFKVRPSTDIGPSRFETGMPNFEAIAGVEAAARFLVEEGMDRLAAAEADLFDPMLEALRPIPGVRVYGETRSRRAHADGRVHHCRPVAGRGRQGAGRRAHRRVGRAQLRGRGGPPARSGRHRRRRARRRVALHQRRGRPPPPRRRQPPGRP